MQRNINMVTFVVEVSVFDIGLKHVECRMPNATQLKKQENFFDNVEITSVRVYKLITTAKGWL